MTTAAKLFLIGEKVDPSDIKSGGFNFKNQNKLRYAESQLRFCLVAYAR